MEKNLFLYDLAVVAILNPKLKNIPVIIMTDTRDFAIISEIKNSPAAGHIKKPVITEEGLALIEEKLRRRR